MVDAKIGANAKKIEITGIVQGIGFRPFVYRLAQKHRIYGSVKNISGYVEIFATGNNSSVDSFLLELLENPPAHSVIENVCVTGIPDFFAKSFVIENSGSGFNDSRFFSPDLAICNNCRDEIFDKSNRRFKHYFNSCVSCGPRFSVLNSFPYDRKNTSMDKFELCPNCSNEYLKPSDRRFHAETIACNDCGPVLFYEQNYEQKNNDHYDIGNEAFQKAIDDLNNGKIVAIKGIGGYHLSCSAYNSEALKKLRELKGREYKPFAIMFKDMAEIEKICTVSENDKLLLCSPARPIVLLRIKNNPFVFEALYNNRRCGCFLPYTPLHELIMDKIPCLIMTSANVSGSPIINDDNEIFSLYNTVLYHNRRIVRSAEDSVAQTVYGSYTQIIRRARGYVPLAYEIDNLSNRNILAMGGDLKASFSLTAGNYLTMSQYFGDLEDAGVMKRYQEEINDFVQLFDIKPDQIVCDIHPRYFSTHIAKKYAHKLNVPLLYVSHHHAHIASVIAEHHLEDEVIGVAFDGSGYGDDGNIWGGEFLICNKEKYRRVGHLEYTALLGEDSAAKDAKKTAACFLYKNAITSDHIDQQIITAALKHNTQTFLSSSMGRLFDAVASIIGVCNENNYEGECASALQYSAEDALKLGVDPISLFFSNEEKDGNIIIRQNEIINKAYNYSRNKCLSSGAFALGFHFAIADMLLKVCQTIQMKEHINKVALSGGVFQNSLLLSLCADKLTNNGFYVYFNSVVPPNDGGLALGQSYIAASRLHL